MSKLVTIIGGSGFVGRYIARRMARSGWRVRVAVRRPNEALFVKPYGSVGQVEPVFCNIRDDASVRAVLEGADAVVNCVGILAESGAQTFDAVQAEGPERVARIAAELGVGRMVQISSIGADAASASDYTRSKANGEAAVVEHMPDAVILRPSIVFGPEDGFFNRFAGMARLSPIVPLVGAETKFQPVYVDDVARAAEMAVKGEAAPGVYELGGEEVLSFRELVQRLMGVIRRRRLILGLPFWAGRLMARGGAVGQFLSLGIVKSPITLDQVADLQHDNVVSEGARGLADLGINPMAMDIVMPEYLWRFRPSGQYDVIKESAQNLRG